MDAKELSKGVSYIIGQTLDTFSNQLDKTSAEIFSQMQTLLNKLDIDSNGYIIQSQANRQVLSKAPMYLNQAITDSGYEYTLTVFSTAVQSITESIDAYYTTVVQNFTIDAQYLKSLQRETISQLESLLINEGLESQVKAPILNILNQNINTGAKYSDLVKQLKDFTLGNSTQQAKLQSYAGQIAYDTLFNFSRALQEAISQGSKLQFVVYLGGLMKDSREFCVERANKYFHYKEVQTWASQDWQGKRAGTNESTIFIYCGGYRCEHQMIYVSEYVVPKEDIERAKSLGFYNN